MNYYLRLKGQNPFNRHGAFFKGEGTPGVRLINSAAKFWELKRQKRGSRIRTPDPYFFTVPYEP